MKTPIESNHPRANLKHVALMAMVAWAGLPAQAQDVFHVGDEGVIGTSTLTTVVEGTKRVATLVNDGVNWTATGGEGIVYSRLISKSLTVPTTGPVTLKFKHRYFLEDGWDGGAVYISVNGGEPTYVDPSAFTANGYDGLLTGPTWVSTVFVGKQTFTGMSAGYDTAELIESVANLGSLTAGDTITIEFRGGWDDAYAETGVNWEIGTVEVRDAATTPLLNVDFLNGPAGFTVVSDLPPAGSWRYLGQSSQFEINGDTLAADRYVPNIPGADTIIDLNGSELTVVLLEGTVNAGDSFTLFDLSGGTTLRGNYYSIKLPDGTWDVSQLAVTGKITCKAIGGGLRVSTFDTIQGTVFLDPIANLLASPPSGTGTQTDNIDYANFTSLPLPGMTSAESFAVLWEGWFDVTVDGPGAYTFGTSSDDGSVVFMDLNDDGDFTDAGEKVVDNNRDQPPTVATGTVTLNMNSVRMLIGFYENGGGEAMVARFKKGSGLAWNSLQPIGGKSGHFSPNPLAPTKEITAFAVAPHGNATILENMITLKVINGDPVTALTPTITINGSSVSPASGVPQNFTNPVTYTVTASDGSTREYYVTVVVINLPAADGVAAWLKADAINPNDVGQGRIYGSNTFVAKWNDQAGNRQHAAQATAASQPQYLANNLNGLPTVKWDGTGKFLRGSLATTIKTIVVVCKKDAEVTGLDGLFCASPSQDNQNIRGNGTIWEAPVNGTNSADFADLGQVYVNGSSGDTHNSQWHILVEESASSPIFAYQLGQTAYNRFLNGRIAEIILYNRALTPEERNAVGGYLADKYALTTTYPPLASQAKLYALGIPGWPGVVNESLKTVTLTVPYSTDVTTLAPTFTMSVGATCDKASGSPQNFTSPVTYTVTSSDSLVSTPYTVTVIKAPVRTEKELLAFGPGAIITGTTVKWTAPYGSDLTALAPTYVISQLATGSPASGATVNFTNPVPYTITAEDGTTKEYIVTAAIAPSPPTTRKPALWLDASQLEGLTDGQVVNTWPDTSGSMNTATRTDGAPEYRPAVLNGKPVVRFGANASFSYPRISTIRSVFWVLKENAGAAQPRFLLGDTSTYHFHRSDAGANGPLWHGTYTNAGILNGTTKLMGTQVNGTTTSMPADTFQMISLVTTGNVQANTLSSDRSTPARSWLGDIAEVLIYDQPLSAAEEAEIGSFLAAKYGLTTTYPAVAPLANLYSFGLLGKTVSVDQGTKSVALEVPYGTDVSAIPTSFVMSGGATCDKVSGASQNFTNPVTFTVKSSDDAITNVYTVAVTVAPKPPSATLPVLWLDASKLTGLTDGQQVDTWRDASGLGNHANRAYGSPVYKTGVINGQPVVRFASGSFNFQRINTIRTVFWVLNETVGASAPRFLLGDSGSYHFHRSADAPNGPLWSQWTNGNIVAGTTKMMGTVVNGATTPLPGGSFQLVSVVTIGNVEANNLSDDRNIANRSWLGDIAEVLIYDKALSSAEEAQVGSYLTAKYGLTTAYPNDYGSWAAAYPGFDLSNPAGDADKDGNTNQGEYAFGLNPTSGSSVSPITVQVDPATGKFSYTRRNPALTGLGYTVWTSPDLTTWTEDTAASASQTVTATNGDVQTVGVTLTTLPVNGKLFVRVKAQ